MLLLTYLLLYLATVWLMSLRGIVCALHLCGMHLSTIVNFVLPEIDIQHVRAKCENCIFIDGLIGFTVAATSGPHLSATTKDVIYIPG